MSTSTRGSGTLKNRKHRPPRQGDRVRRRSPAPPRRAIERHGFIFDPGRKAVRDPIWKDISIPDGVDRLIASAPFFRLSKLNQLEFVCLVFPGARHTRLEHSLGVFHVTRWMVREMLNRGVPLPHDPEGLRRLLAAALLHDIGHYPFAHTTEHLKLPGVVHHEEAARRQILETEVREILIRDFGIRAPERVVAIINDKGGDDPVDRLSATILSGIADPDKVDYLTRDAHYCGVPYGAVDIHRLLPNLTLTPDRARIAITEKGIAPVESIVFARYMMFRHVYWHHTVRAAATMVRRTIHDALLLELIAASDLYRLGTDELFSRIAREIEVRQAHSRNAGNGSLESLGVLLAGFTQRRNVHKRGITLHAGEYDPVRAAKLFRDPDLWRTLELEMSRTASRLARSSAGEHAILLEIPRPETSFGRLDLPVELAGSKTFVEFEDERVSPLAARLLADFEARNRKVRILVRDEPTLLAAVRSHSDRFRRLFQGR